MKVLVITNAYPSEKFPHRGVFIKEQVESLGREGADIDALWIRGEESRANYLLALFELHKRLARGHYDLIHCHYGLSGIIGRLQCSYPLVVSFLGDDVQACGTFSEKFTYFISRVIARFTNAVIVKSDRMRKLLGINKCLYIVPSGVDMTLFKEIPRVEAKRKLGLSEEKQYLLFPSSPSNPVKNFSLAEESINILKKNKPNTELLILDGVEHKEIPYYLNASSCLMLTSLREGSPNVVKEALACNVPVVSVPVGDVQVLLNNVTGCYVVKYEADDIACHLHKVLSTNCRINGRDAAQKLELQLVAKRIVEIYRLVLSKPKSV